MHLPPRFGFLIGLFALSVLLAGCGGGKPVAPGEGTATLNGTPVTSGFVGFTPIATSEEKLPGKPATGAIGSDGHFVLSTYEQGDGAVIGRHRVAVTPQGEEDAAALRGVELPENELEVKEGNNEFKLELTR